MDKLCVNVDEQPTQAKRKAYVPTVLTWLLMRCFTSILDTVFLLEKGQETGNHFCGDRVP